MISLPPAELSRSFLLLPSSRLWRCCGWATAAAWACFRRCYQQCWMTARVKSRVITIGRSCQLNNLRLRDWRSTLQC